VAPAVSGLAIVDAVVAAIGDRPIRAPGSARPAVVEPRREEDLAGRHVVVTGGGTAEPIDPVRFIGNRSTGRMGVAIAEAALDRGASVTLIVGLVAIALPSVRESSRLRRPRQCAPPSSMSSSDRMAGAGWTPSHGRAAVIDFRRG
jgi:hypothetical protein